MVEDAEKQREGRLEVLVIEEEEIRMCVFEDTIVCSDKSGLPRSMHGCLKCLVNHVWNLEKEVTKCQENR